MRGWRMGLALALLAAQGCAKGGALGEDQQDAGPLGEDAASQPDADPGPTPATLSQTTSTDITDNNAIACLHSVNGTPVYHNPNQYFRVFDLAAEGIDGDFEVDKVTLGIENADPGGAQSQTIEVKLHTLDGSFVIANLTQLASTQVSVDSQSLTMLDVDLQATVPAGSKLVAEVFTPTGDPDRFFIMGSNAAGESAPGFIRAPLCGFDEPIDISTIDVNGSPSTMDMILQVHGVY